MYNIFGVGRGPQIYKICTSNVCDNWGRCWKIVKNTHLLVIMSVRLSQKIGLLDLTNRTQFKKGNGYKIRTKSVRDYWGMSLMLHTRSIYYWHKNADLLGVCSCKNGIVWSWNHEVASNLSITQVQILCIPYLRASNIIILSNVSRPTDMEIRKYPIDSGFPSELWMNAVQSWHLRNPL